MSFNELPESVKNHILIKYAAAAVFVVLGCVFGVVLRAFLSGALPCVIAAAYMVWLGVTAQRSIRSDGLFYTEGKLVRVDRTITNKTLRRIYNKTDAPRAFYLIADDGSEVRVRPDGRKWHYEVGDHIRIYYLERQKPRNVDGALVFYDYLLYEQMTVDSGEKTTE